MHWTWDEARALPWSVHQVLVELLNHEFRKRPDDDTDPGPSGEEGS